MGRCSVPSAGRSRNPMWAACSCMPRHASTIHWAMGVGADGCRRSQCHIAAFADGVVQGAQCGGHGEVDARCAYAFLCLGVIMNRFLVFYILVFKVWGC